MNTGSIEPPHNEHGAYQNWYRHYRNQTFKSWQFWMSKVQLPSGGNNNRPRKEKRNNER